MPKWFIAKHLRLWLLASTAALGGAGLGASITLGNAPLASEAPSLPRTSAGLVTLNCLTALSNQTGA